MMADDNGMLKQKDEVLEERKLKEKELAEKSDVKESAEAVSEAEGRCRECEKSLVPGEYIETEQGAFCRSCYEKILNHIKAALAEQSRNINYPVSVLGAVLGGAAGAAVWWAVTFFTGYAVGLVAIVIGITVAKGMTFLNGGKRSRSLQILAVVTTLVSYFYAEYLVARSFIIKERAAYAEFLSLIPDPEIFFGLLKETFDVMSLVFLAIAVWQAWAMTQPVKID